MKRSFDFFVSLLGMLFLSPLIIISCILIFKQDFKSPLFIAKRVGKNSKEFNMVKLRTMVVNENKNKVDSTSKNDPRITKTGRYIRKFKLDELAQLFNVFTGDMSFVGPRPNVKRETDIYTDIEKQLLFFKPGITDIASIVFSDESEILSNVEDPDIGYNQLIRPWKSRLGLFYIKKQSFLVDLIVIVLTFINIFSRRKSLFLLNLTLKKLKAPKELSKLVLREDQLEPLPPPGSSKLVLTRDLNNS